MTMLPSMAFGLVYFLRWGRCTIFDVVGLVQLFGLGCCGNFYVHIARKCSVHCPGTWTCYVTAWSHELRYFYRQSKQRRSSASCALRTRHPAKIRKASPFSSLHSEIRPRRVSSLRIPPHISGVKPVAFLWGMQPTKLSRVHRKQWSIGLFVRPLPTRMLRRPLPTFVFGCGDKTWLIVVRCGK